MSATDTTKTGLRVVFAPVITWFRQFTGMFVYGFGFFVACLSFDYLYWALAIPATLGGIALIAVGLYMTQDRDHDPLAERIRQWRSS